MASFIGRDATLTWNSVLVGGVRTRGLSIANTSVDITSDDDSGIRTLLAEAGENQVDITVSGILESSTLMEDAQSGAVTSTMLLQFPIALDNNLVTGPSISGTFMMTSFSISGEYNGAPTFDATFNSSGAVTFTAGTDA